METPMGTATGTALLLVLLSATTAAAATLTGHVRKAGGDAIVGALVTARQGDPIRDVTVYSDEKGGFELPGLHDDRPWRLRVRRIGWRDASVEGVGSSTELEVSLTAETDMAELAAQLPANRWYALLLDQVGDPAQREELVRQCTYCHQQGNAATRRLRDPAEWQKVLALMARMGAGLSPELRARIPELTRAAYDPERAVAALTAQRRSADFAPPPSAEARRARIDEWELGQRASMQHDIVVHPDGRIYSVDMTQDKLYRLDPRDPDGGRASFDVPQGDLPLGGIFGGDDAPAPPNSNSRVGPHSLQVAPDGAVWMTLALGNQLARFDPEGEAWSIYPLEEGYYPHTLRFDSRGRIWYTVAVSNHVGMLDPATGEHRWLRLPTRSFGQSVVLRLLPFFLWASQTFDLSGAGEGGGEVTLPVPYGIDVAPDGSIWFSQLNEHRIGRIDPDDLSIEMVDTPFTGPRRLRFDSKGMLWIPGFSSGLVSRFDPASRAFESWPLPIEPIGSETPYALNVDPSDDAVWICGTNSDTLIRFDPADERFVVYPLPTRVTYTREIDFDEDGGVWTSNSNLPVWQIEGGFPRVLRLDPNRDEQTPSEQVAIRPSR
jgi:virginiamycin B lyase